MFRHLSVVLLALLFCDELYAQQKKTREQKVREDRDRVVQDGFWIYNDLPAAFAAFMLNADRTIYGRFGTRSHRTEWIGDVSLPGLAAALQGALALHENYPANRDALAGKSGPQPLFARPELFPSLKDKYSDTLSYSGDVVKSCIQYRRKGELWRLLLIATIAAKLCDLNCRRAGVG